MLPDYHGRSIPASTLLFSRLNGPRQVLVPFTVAFAYIRPFSSGNRRSSDEDRGYTHDVPDNSKATIQQRHPANSNQSYFKKDHNTILTLIPSLSLSISSDPNGFHLQLFSNVDKRHDLTFPHLNLKQACLSQIFSTGRQRTPVPPRTLRIRRNTPPVPAPAPPIHPPAQQCMVVMDAHISSIPSRSTIVNLPYDIFLRIFRFIPSHDLVHLLSCCHDLHALANVESIWRSLSSIYGLHDVTHFNGRSWFTVYVQLLHVYGPMLGLWAGDQAYTGEIVDIRLHPGDTSHPGSIVLGAWSFRPIQLEYVDGPEMPEFPIYTPLIRIGFSAAKGLHGGPRIACCAHPEAASHSAYIELFSSSSESLVLHTRDGQRYPHPEFPIPEIHDLVDPSRYPLLPLCNSIDMDRGSCSTTHHSRGHTVVSGHSNHLKPRALSVSCAFGCVNRARVFHGFHEDRPSLARYYPLRRRVLPGMDPSSSIWHPSSLVGLWLGSHGPHGTECLYLDWSDSSSTLRAWKVTGDTNVPRGAVSWSANGNDPRPPSQLPEWVNDYELGDVMKCRCFGGTGVVSARGFL